MFWTSRRRNKKISRSTERRKANHEANIDLIFLVNINILPVTTVSKCSRITRSRCPTKIVVKLECEASIAAFLTNQSVQWVSGTFLFPSVFYFVAHGPSSSEFQLPVASPSFTEEHDNGAN